MKKSIQNETKNSDLEGEDFKIKETKRINIDDLNSDFLLNLEEDVLYEFSMSSY